MTAACAVILSLATGLWWSNAADDPAAISAELIAAATSAGPSGAAHAGAPFATASPPPPQQPARQDIMASDEATLGAQQRYQYTLTHLRDVLSEAQAAPGNLQAFFSELAQYCDSAARCQALLAEVLAGYPDPAFAEMVARIQERMPAYEAAMQSTVMSMSEPPAQRFNTLQALREQMLGREEAELMYGQEAAWARYRLGYGELMASAGQMPPDARQQALDALRQQHFGDYAEALREVEGARGAYEHALALQLTGVTSEAERQRITQSLRRQYFTDEQIQAMNQRDQQLAAQAEQLAAYQAAVAALDAEFGALQGTLPATQWQSEYQARLSALRQAHFSSGANAL